MLSLISPVQSTFRRDLPVNDAGLVDPTSTSPLPLLQGEWVTINDTSGKVERSSGSTHGDVYQVFTQKGDTSAQAIGRVTLLYLHDYIAETTQYNNGDTFVVGDALIVDTVTNPDGVSVSGLTNASIAAGDYVVGYVEFPLPAANGGKLRFRKIAPVERDA